MAKIEGHQTIRVTLSDETVNDARALAALTGLDYHDTVAVMATEAINHRMQQVRSLLAGQPAQDEMPY